MAKGNEEGGKAEKIACKYLNIWFDLLAICDFYGKEYPNSITRDEFFFYLDSFFRGLYKVLIKKDGSVYPPKSRKRL